MPLNTANARNAVRMAGERAWQLGLMDGLRRRGFTPDEALTTARDELFQREVFRWDAIEDGRAVIVTLHPRDGMAGVIQDVYRGELLWEMPWHSGTPLDVVLATVSHATRRLSRD